MFHSPQNPVTKFKRSALSNEAASVGSNLIQKSTKLIKTD